MKVLAVDFSIVFITNYHIVKRITKGDPIDKLKFTTRLINSISDVVMLTHCKNVIICADSSSWRKKICSEYKRNRVKKDPDFFKLMDYTLHHIKNQWQVVQVPGLEADDLLGLVSSKYKTVILTNDKDLYQLINKDTEVFLFTGKQFVKNINPNWELFKKIALGDKGDNVTRSIKPGIGPVNLKNYFLDESEEDYISPVNTIIDYDIAISVDKVLHNERLVSLDPFFLDEYFGKGFVKNTLKLLDF